MDPIQIPTGKPVTLALSTGARVTLTFQEDGTVVMQGGVGVALTPSEVEQLTALYHRGTTRPGYLISTDTEKALREKGLTGRSEDGEWCMVNSMGVDWLRQAAVLPLVDGP